MQIRLATSRDMSSFCGMVMRSSTFSNNSWDSFVCFSMLWGKTTVNKSSRSARRAPRTVAAIDRENQSKRIEKSRKAPVQKNVSVQFSSAQLGGLVLGSCSQRHIIFSLTVGTWGTGSVDMIATEYQCVGTRHQSVKKTTNMSKRKKTMRM